MRFLLHGLATMLTLVTLSACSTNDTETTDNTTSSDTFTLRSSAIVNGELLAEFQCEQKNNGIEDSIPLEWSGVPDDAKSLAVTMHHYPNPEDTNSVSSYLTLWGIDPSVTEIEHGQADDGSWFMGSNKDGDAISYTSPCSPSVGSHSYTVTLYALSTDPVASGLLPASSSLEVDYTVLRNAVDEAGVLLETAVTFNSTTGGATDTGSMINASAFEVCEDLDATFAHVSDVATPSCDDTYLLINSPTGLPPTQNVISDESIMTGITSWIQRVPVPFSYDWKIPRNPSWSNVTTEASPKGPIAVAIDGVPIFHYERRPDVSTALSNYTSENDTVLAGELDQCGGHAGQGDDYHYHYAPVCLLDEHDLTQPLAFGLDGAPVFFGQAGTDYYGGGRFNDWDNFPTGVTANDLDDCNAVMQSDGSYIHYSTKTAPYMIGCHHGVFDLTLQIEPSPMTGREQGLETPLGGQYGEPVTTLMSDFSDDGNGEYTLKFAAVDGSNRVSAIIYSISSTSDTETCWSFEFRTDENQPGELQTACRNSSGPSALNDEVQFEHSHVH